MPTAGAMDPNQPSVRAMSMVKIRNNITDRQLQRTLDHFELEKSNTILMIDHDRLDMRDFLRSIKHCGSDELPEARHWLRDGVHFPVKKKKKKRIVQSAPIPEGDQAQKGGPNDPDLWSDEWQAMDPFAKVRFAQHNMRRSSLVHQDIYSRRNMLSSIDREVQRPPPPGRLEVGTGIRRAYEVDQLLSPAKEDDRGSLENKNVKFQEADSKSATRTGSGVENKLKDIQELEKRVESLRSPVQGKPGSKGRLTTPVVKSKLPPATAPAPSGDRGKESGNDSSPREKADILLIEREGSKTPMAREISRAPEPERPKTQGAEGSRSFMTKIAEGFHHKTPGGRDKDFMKDLLVKNARRRYRKKKAVPIEDRLQAFYTKIDNVKRREEEQASAPISMDMQRKWILLTKGIDAALAESSEEDEPRKQTA